MNKRGSHVEIIIAFVIFVTFVVFLISSLVPSISTKKDKENIFDGVEYKIIEKVSHDVTQITVNLYEGGGNCVNLDNIINDLGIENNIIVKDSAGGNVESSVNGDSISINREDVNSRFYKIYYSNQFDELPSGSGCSPNNYQVGLTKTDKYIFQEEFMDLINRDYQTLKYELKIPQGIEFGYGIVLSNGTTFETKRDDISTNVYIRETPMEYVDLEGNILVGHLKTVIW